MIQIYGEVCGLEITATTGPFEDTLWVGLLILAAAKCLFSSADDDLTLWKEYPCCQ
jgi:hypothetical protein